MLSGSLSRSPHGQIDNYTDPHAIVRAPAAPPPAIRPTAGQVGGRAMLDPDEPLTGQLARLHGAPTGRPPASSPAPTPAPRQAPNRPGPTPLSGTDEWQTEIRREGAGRRRARSGGAVMAEQVAGRVKAMGREAGRSRGRTMVIVGAALAIVVGLAAIGAMSGWFSGGSGVAAPPPATTPAITPTPDQPLIAEVQQYADRGISVNVPKNWTKSGSGTYVDYTDPANNGRKIRINIEDASGDAEKFFTTAETGLKKPSTCPSPYKRVALTPTTLAQKPANQLEYTCGSGSSMRHGIWDAVVVGGKVYHFYLTVPDAKFGDSKIIFEEMARSFSFV
jgi:hypothetical protein